jgi:hypothetical protein
MVHLAAAVIRAINAADNFGDPSSQGQKDLSVDVLRDFAIQTVVKPRQRSAEACGHIDAFKSF